MNKKLKIGFLWIYHHLELLLWLLIVVLLLLPMPIETHFTLCPFSNLGWHYCPGCGVGRACHLALQGNLGASLAMHPLGIFALIVIFFRIFSLIKFSIYQSKTQSL
jgi:uncharacterized membrane protein